MSIEEKYKSVTAPSQFPKQKVSSAEKEEDDFLFAKQCTEYLISNHGFNNEIYEEMDTLYNARVGRLQTSDYKLQTNPFNSNTTGQNVQSRQPAVLKHYPLIEPICELMLSEYSKRPKVMDVVAVNEHVENEYKEAANFIYKQNLKQKFINELHAQGLEVGEAISEEELEAKTQKQLKEVTVNLSESGQNSINILRYELRLVDKWQEAFDDWLTVGTAITRKDVVFNDVDYKPISPRKLSFARDMNSSPYIEDLPDALYRDYWSINNIIDYFRDELSDEDVTCLETKARRDGVGASAATIQVARGGIITGNTGQEEPTRRSLVNSEIEVYHAVWKSFKKVGILTYVTEMGEIRQQNVDDTYKLDEEKGDISVEWEWVNEVWETWRLAEGVYVRTRPVMVQRNEISNISKCKLPYNGRWRRTRTGDIVSVVKTGLPFQFTYNALNYSAEKMMNKNKDKMLMMPYGLIPKKAGWNTDTFMYYATSLGFAFYDETADNASVAMQGIKSVDMSLSEYIYRTYEMLQAVKTEYWDAVGMNRQRYGDVNTSAGKGVTEQAIYRSSMISEESYRQFDDFVESELNGLLDNSRLAWVEGKKSKIYNDNGQELNLLIANPTHTLTDYLVFVKNGDDEARSNETMKQLALSFIQNDTPKATVAEIVDSKNMTTLKRILKEYDDVEEEFKQRQQQANEQAVQQQAETKKYEVDLKAETERYKAETNAEAMVNVALIRANDGDDVSEEGDNSLERDKFDYSKTKDSAERQQKDRHHKDDIRLKEKMLKKQQQKTTQK